MWKWLLHTFFIYLAILSEWVNPVTTTICVCVCAQLLTHVGLFVTPWTVALQTSLSLKFPRQAYWSGLPFPSPGDLPDPGIESMSPVSPALQADSLPLSHPRSPYYNVIGKSQCSLYIPLVINNFILVSFLLSYLKSVLKCFCFVQWFLHYFIRCNNKLYYIMY